MDTQPDNLEASAFSLLSRPIQEQLWNMGWKSLRPLQTSAIHAIFETRKQIILSAPTASGKTEAAFLPALSIIGENPMGSVRAIYVGPLKALINDQFGRLGELCAKMDLPVHSWHGDVSGNKKEKLIEEPGGVLLITPESIEAIFANRPRKLKEVFHGLRFVVIDELHTFLDNERGLHLRSLLTRLAGKVERP